jgi:hypothetical protein
MSFSPITLNNMQPSSIIIELSYDHFFIETTFIFYFYYQCHN